MGESVQEHPETVGISPLSRGLAKFETALVAVSSCAIAVIMFVVVADVLMRYLFSAPLSWSYNLIGLYLVVAMFFLALPDTLHHHGHIAVDIFQHMIPFRLRHLALGIGYGMSTVVVGLIFWGGWERFLSAWINDDRIAAQVPWPTWVAYLIVALGSFAMALRCLYRTGGHFASAFTGRELVKMPLPPETGQVSEAE